MSEVMIAFDGVWKKFRRGERHDSLRDPEVDLYLVNAATGS